MFLISPSQRIAVCMTGSSSRAEILRFWSLARRAPNKKDIFADFSPGTCRREFGTLVDGKCYSYASFTKKNVVCSAGLGLPEPRAREASKCTCVRC